MIQKNSGFTALELAPPIATVAVVAASIMPPCPRWNRSRQLEGVVVNLIPDLEMAKVRI
jgi:Tfp pilus assembly protein FimT